MATSLTRRHFLKNVSVGAGVTALTAGGGSRKAAAQAAAAPYPDWIAASPKPPKRGGVLTRA